MKKKFYFIIIISAMFLLSSCNDPEYVTKEDIIPPTDNAGLQCLQAIDERENIQAQKCYKKQEACLESVREQAAERLSKMLSIYHNQKSKYQSELEVYAEEFKIYKVEKELFLSELEIKNDKLRKIKRECRLNSNMYDSCESDIYNNDIRELEKEIRLLRSNSLHSSKLRLKRKKSELARMREECRFSSDRTSSINFFDSEFCQSEIFNMKNDISAFERVNIPVRPEKPHKLLKPTLKSIISAYSTSCNIECRSKKSKKETYVSCGGKVISRRHCVKNCK